MKVFYKYFFLIPVFFLIPTGFTGLKYPKERLKMPFKEAGLTERQAAAHLLSRFTFGARPGEVDLVLRMGLKNWFLNQLEANNPEDSLNFHLMEFPDLGLSNADMIRTFPFQGMLIQMAIKDSVISKDSVGQLDRPHLKLLLADFMRKKGLKPEGDLVKELSGQKIIRAVYSTNQLREVMTDFWFNHFNVSMKKEDCSRFIPDFERDVIRPNALGNFPDLLLATAKSPAMAFYLDNFTSAYTDTSKNNIQKQRAYLALLSKNPKDSLKYRVISQNLRINPKRVPGLNENYAREVMELHTLGVDGGYTQSDVTQAARVLTGWTVYPMRDQGPTADIKKLLDKMSPEEMTQKGFIHDGDFLFAPNRHDPNPKYVLGHNFPAGGGYQEGVDLLMLLAHHNSTAHFLAKKLAIRFVNDNPSKALIEKMAKTYMETGGDIKEVLISMVSSPEFWNSSSLRQKTKSPFEYAISSIRGLNSQVIDPNGINYWLTRMGEQIYYYTAPTGFPDQGAYWINTGSLLNRMNFGLLFASNRVNGVKSNLLGLNNNHEPESNQKALETYSSILLPERNLEQTIQRLTPLLNHPNLSQKIDDASNQTNMPTKKVSTQDNAAFNPNSLGQVVGIIIGSPEFQRR